MDEQMLAGEDGLTEEETVEKVKKRTGPRAVHPEPRPASVAALRSVLKGKICSRAFCREMLAFIGVSVPVEDMITPRGLLCLPNEACELKIVNVAVPCYVTDLTALV